MRSISSRLAVAAIVLTASPAAAQQNVVWMQTVNATASGNALQKVSGCGTCPDAGGISQQQMASGLGSAQWQPSPGSGTSLALYAGLGSGLSTPPAAAQYKYAFSFWQNGGWDIRELGVYKTEGTFVAGDVFTIAIETGPVVKYYKNGAVVYTSAVAPTAYPYVLGSTIYAIGAGVTAAAITTGSSGSTAPATYTAITDRVARTKPAAPTLGAAGYHFSDPTFSSQMLRVTDAATRPGTPDRSYRMPSNSHLAAWNTTASRFYVVSTDGTIIPYTFDAATMAAARIQPSGTGNGGLTLAFVAEPQFSLVNANAIFGIGGANNRTIRQYDFGTGAYTTVLDLDTVVSGLTGYTGGLMTGGTSPEQAITIFGGGSQDQHFYALLFAVTNPASRKLVNTLTSTVNGTPTNITLNFRLHAMEIDRSGRYVLLFPTGVDRGSPRFASPAYLWDTATDLFTALTTGGSDGGTQMLPGGHDSAGFGVWINQDCCTSTTWDAAQWQFRSFSSPQTTRDMILPVLTPKEIYLADHQTWNNAQPGTLVPVFSSTYRYGDNTAPWRAWDDEVIAIQTSAPTGTGATVWRFAHHRSNLVDDHNPSASYFWYQPIANVSPDGRWILFTSNWEKSLGSDPGDGQHREDVFLVKLVPGQ